MKPRPAPHAGLFTIEPRPQEPAPPSAVKPTRRGAQWTQDEKNFLRAEFLNGTTVDVLAQLLGRSERAVRWVLHRLRLIPFPAADVPVKRDKEPKAYTLEGKRQLYPNAYRPWLADDDRRLAERCATGATLAELVEEFGRNPGGIASRLVSIDAQGPAADEAWGYGGDDPTPIF